MVRPEKKKTKKSGALGGKDRKDFKAVRDSADVPGN